MNKLLLFLLLIITCFFANAQTQPEQIQDIETLFENNEYEKVISILEEKRKNDSLTLREYFLITKSYGRARKYSNGFIFSQKMLNKALQNRDTTNTITAVNLMAENLVDLGEMNKAIEACNAVESYFREKDSVEYQKLCFKLGVAYYHTEQYQKAYETYQKITKPEYRKLSLFTNNYALTLMGLNKLDEAIPYLHKSIQTKKEKGSNYQLNVSYNNLALIHMHKKKWKLAEKYLDSSAKVLTAESQLTDRKHLYERYFELYLKQNQFDKASLYLENINRVNEKIFEKRTSEKISEIKHAYDREKKLKKEVKIIDNQLASSQKQKLIGAILALLLILGLLVGIFYYKYQNILSAHQQVRTEQKLLRSQMTPHFIFNSLSVLQGMILNKEDKTAVRYLSKFSKLLRLILENSREKLVLLEDELKALKNYVDLQNMQAKNSFEFSLQLDENVNEQEIFVPPMLIQPFVENAIEHGFNNSIDNPELNVHLFFKQNQLYCEISDNGTGIKNGDDNNKVKKSLATKITNDRLKAFSKEYNTTPYLKIENRKKYNQQGTQVSLILPHSYENA